MSGVQLTERETLVARSFFGRYKPEQISNEVWKDIANEAQITNGDVGRNAKFAFNNLIKKLASGGSGAEASPSPSKSASKPKGVTKAKITPKGKGGRKAASKQDMWDEAVAAADAEAEEDIKPKIEHEGVDVKVGSSSLLLE